MLIRDEISFWLFREDISLVWFVWLLLDLSMVVGLILALELVILKSEWVVEFLAADNKKVLDFYISNNLFYRVLFLK